jgi:hypothetical protein
MELRPYRLVIEGKLDDHVAGAFKLASLEREAGTTILTGPVKDLADLQGCYSASPDWA